MLVAKKEKEIGKRKSTLSSKPFTEYEFAKFFNHTIGTLSNEFNWLQEKQNKPPPLQVIVPNC